MCGIAGLWVRSADASARDLPAIAEAMASRLHRRGPDGAGCWSDPEAGIALAHRRLAVVDLTAAGAQPMESACGRFVISFNGEIYNHVRLRQELEAEQAMPWRGHSDTETLLELIVRRGLEGALQRCIGAFALALWDRRERRLLLARDRLGEKPLYYGWSEGRLLFASELKAMQAVPGFANPVDPDALALYLRANCIPAPWSILQGIHKVRPGTIVALGAADRAAVDGAPYWSLDEVIARPTGDLAPSEAVDRLEALLLDAVGQQVLADVPVGAFLSGGIDSSLITTLMAHASRERIRTFTIGFAEAGFDEAPHARAVARHLGSEHTELYLDASQIRAEIPQLPDIYDEPFADSSQLPTLLVSRLARQQVTVALSGDAGDELFCGYNRYLVSRRSWQALAAIPPGLRHLLAAAGSVVPPAAWDRLGRLPGLPQVPMLGSKAAKVMTMLRGDLGVRAIYRASSEEWYGALPLLASRQPQSRVDLTEPARSSAEEAMMQWDMAGYLTDDILTKVDRAAMANSLEVRVPLLDHRVVEFAWGLPLSLKKRGRQGKWLLRQVLSRHVPDELIDRPKSGFAVPVGAWLRGELRDWAEDLLSADELARDGLLDPAPIRQRWAQHLAGSHDWTGSLWGILMYRAWARRWSAAC
jgi:asparagine synthase (glutamine-hydrolysing)